MSNTVYFSGVNKRIKLSAAGSYSTERIYSLWKEWVSEGINSAWPPAFDTIGGDEVGENQEVAPYFFCRNDSGWRIEMPNADGDVVIAGNLFPRDPSTSMFIQTPGHATFLRLEVSTRAVVLRPTGDDYLTAAQAATLEGISANAGLIPALL